MVIPKFGKKVGNGNGNSNYRNAVEPKKCGKKVSKFLLKDSRKTVNISVIFSKKNSVIYRAQQRCFAFLILYSKTFQDGHLLRRPPL